MGKCGKSGVNSLVMDFHYIQKRGVGGVVGGKFGSLDFSTMSKFSIDMMGCPNPHKRAPKLQHHQHKLHHTERNDIPPPDPVI